MDTAKRDQAVIIAKGEYEQMVHEYNDIYKKYLFWKNQRDDAHRRVLIAQDMYNAHLRAQEADL